jgi:hypothetical protein
MAEFFDQDIVDSKRCTKCGIVKPFSDFSRMKNGKFGLRSQCKVCASMLSLSWYNYNRERVKVYKHNRKEQIKQKNKDWRSVNSEQIKIKRRVYREVNKKQLNIKSSCWYNNNKEQKLSSSKAWYKANSKRRNIVSMAYNKKRYQTDCSFRLKDNLRAIVYKALKGSSKSAHTMELIGCSIKELWLHLESQFTYGMTRENHGQFGWHVDHIIPCASFDLTDPEQQRKCFHYTNLQPLWAEDNLSKSDNVDWVKPNHQLPLPSPLTEAKWAG